MVRYVIRRVIVAALMLLLIASMTFLLMNAVPGGPFLSEKAPSQATLDALNAKYGLDKPVMVQLVNYIKALMQGDFGVSFRMQRNRPITAIISEMFPISAKLGVVSILTAVIFGIPMGCIAAYKQGKTADNALRVVTTLGIAIPGFVLAALLQYLLCVKFRVFSSMSGSLISPKQYVLPVFALSFYPMCYIGRLMRSSMLDAINQDYVRTARAKGVRTLPLIFKHTMRNAVIPVITYLGPLTAYTLTGGFVVESVFSIPGLGRYFIQSILNRDYPLIMGTTIFLAALVVMMNLLVDIAYKFVDPRINLAKEAE
ncbi:peptide ABC transporter permease [Clostridia bacterium]|nr:peptide ABC transporter permease [Clostridia bacterium]